jgi:hypothetical protein
MTGAPLHIRLDEAGFRKLVPTDQVRGLKAHGETVSLETAGGQEVRLILPTDQVRGLKAHDIGWGRIRNAVEQARERQRGREGG